jgi:CRP-like cAMP-binding protein
MLWLYDFLTPAVLLRHVTLFLLVAAMAMPSLLLLRVVALASGLVAIVLSGFVAYDPVSLFWAVLFVSVIIIKMVLHARHHRGRPLTPEERLFHEKVVPSLSPTQTQRLIDAGRWRDVAAGTALTRQGEVVRELCFISRGRADIMVDERKVAECGPGSLIGEIGLSTGDAATATAVCTGPVRYLGFEATSLYGLLDRHPDLADAVELAIQRSLRDKLHRSNFATAHAGAEPEN